MEGSEKKLGFGCMRFPLLNKDDSASIDVRQVEKMIDLFMKRGFTYFDTAYPYHKGHSEQVLKEVLVKRYPRDSYTVTDKCPTFAIHKKEDFERIFEEQLNRTGLSYFDYYWLHALDNSRYEKMESLGGFEFMKQLKKEGRVHHIGFSFHDTADVLEKILIAHPEMEIVQLQINYEDWENAVVQAKANYMLCEKYHKKVVVMEPVKGGRLAKVPAEADKIFKSIHPEMSDASWAIRFAASLPSVMVVLSGMSSLEQVEDNTSYMEDFKPLDEEEKEAIRKAQEIIKKNLGIPCTGCHYCTDGCPKKIDIPTYFSLYNYTDDEDDRKGLYKKAAVGHGLASECIECGQCERMCPQHLPIRTLLAEKIVPTFEK